MGICFRKPQAADPAHRLASGSQLPKSWKLCKLELGAFWRELPDVPAGTCCVVMCASSQAVLVVCVKGFDANSCSSLDSLWKKTFAQVAPKADIGSNVQSLLFDCVYDGPGLCPGPRSVAWQGKASNRPCQEQNSYGSSTIRHRCQSLHS